MDSVESIPPAPSDPVALYLVMLELALSGRNPVMVHDALVDAEGHLRAAIAAGATPQRAVDDFGQPEDIARAYVEADDPRRGLPRDALSPVLQPMFADLSGGATGAMGGASGGATTGDAAFAAASSATAANALVAPEPIWRRAARVPVVGIWFNRYAWGSLFFFTTVGFAFAVAVFCWVVFMGSLSLGLMPIAIGLVFLLLLLGSVRGLCLLDGMLCEFFLGVRMPRRTQPVYTTSGISLWQRLGCWLKDVRSWLSLGYLLGNFPVAIGLFVMFVTLTALSASFIGAPITSLLDIPFAQFRSDSEVQVTVFWQTIEPDADGRYLLPFTSSILMFFCGLLMATCTLWLARGIGWVYGHVVQAIQVARPRAVLVRPVERVAPIS